MNRFIIPAMLATALLAVPGTVTADSHEPACMGAAEWTPVAAGMEVGSVNDSHNCLGVGWRDGSGLWTCDFGIGYGPFYTSGPCYGWLWVYGGEVAQAISSA